MLGTMEASIQETAYKISDQVSTMKSQIDNMEARLTVVEQHLIVGEQSSEAERPALRDLCDIILQEQNLDQKEPSEFSSDLFPLLAPNQPVNVSTSTPHQSIPVSTNSSSLSVPQFYPSKQQTPAANGHISPFAANIVKSALKNSTERHLGVLEALPSLFSKADRIACNCRGTDGRLRFHPVRLEFLKSKPCYFKFIVFQ